MTQHVMIVSELGRESPLTSSLQVLLDQKVLTATDSSTLNFETAGLMLIHVAPPPVTGVVVKLSTQPSDGLCLIIRFGVKPTVAGTPLITGLSLQPSGLDANESIYGTIPSTWAAGDELAVRFCGTDKTWRIV